MAVGFLLTVLVLAPQAGAQDYLTDLGTSLDLAGDFLDEAAAAIEECNVALIDCLRNPDPTADRIEAANLGLQGVITNLSLLQPPAEHAASHDQLLLGLGKVSTGLTLYTEGLRQNDPTKLARASDALRDGRDDIRTATNAIASQSAGSTDLLTLVTFAVIAAAGAMVVLLVVLVRSAHRQRLNTLHKELATCPLCGEVLDQWSTYKVGQIRTWQQEHLKSHRDEGLPPGSGKF